MTKYTKFLAMIFTSTAAMLLMMYFNTYAFDHIFFSETRFYMAIYMGSIMAIIMLLFMLNMYENKAKNWTILLGSGLIFVISLYLVRSQSTIADEAWMKASQYLR
jgi:multisubunit Na+/H+ antiporter MnhE subunit